MLYSSKCLLFSLKVVRPCRVRSIASSLKTHPSSHLWREALGSPHTGCGLMDWAAFATNGRGPSKFQLLFALSHLTLGRLFGEVAGNMDPVGQQALQFAGLVFTCSSVRFSLWLHKRFCQKWRKERTESAFTSSGGMMTSHELEVLVQLRPKYAPRVLKLENRINPNLQILSGNTNGNDTPIALSRDHSFWSA